MADFISEFLPTIFGRPANMAETLSIRVAVVETA